MTEKVLAFGEVMMRLATPSHLTLPQTNTFNVAYTGTGLNVLSGLSHFKLRTSLMTKLPVNRIGDAAIAHIRSLGIGTEDISRGGQFIGKYFLEQGFDLRPSSVTYSNRTESSFCKSTVEDYDFDAIFEGAQMIHFCGITLAISDETRNLLLTVAKEAKKRNLTVVFDSNFRPKLWRNDYELAKEWYNRLLPYVDICMMTDLDAEKILGFKTEEKGKKERIVDLLPKVSETYKIQRIAGTIRNHLGGKEQSIQAFMYANKELTYSRPYKFQVLDRIGGGDGFASGIIYGHLQGLSKEETVEFAAASGVLTHTTYGDSPINSEEDVWGLVRGENSQDVKR